MIGGALRFAVPALVIADFVSLWFLYDYLRPAYSGPAAVLVVFLYVLAAIFAGVWILRIGGAVSLHNVWRTGVQGGRVHRAMLRGIAVLAAGLLVIFPGLVSDVFGLLLLTPPVQAVVARAIRKRVVVVGGPGRRPPPPGDAPSREPRRGDGPVDVDDYRVE